MEMIDLSLGSTAQYGESLAALSRGSRRDPTPRALREIVATLVSTTREVARDNRTLEARLRESRATRSRPCARRWRRPGIESLTDPLTGLVNRKHFEEMLQQARSTSATAAAQPLAPDRDRHRLLQALQRHLRAPDRRPGAAARRRRDARHASGARDPRRASAARSSAILLPGRSCGPAARDRGGDGPPSVDGPRARQALHRRVARQGHHLARRRGASRRTTPRSRCSSAPISACSRPSATAATAPSTTRRSDGRRRLQRPPDGLCGR